MITKNPTTFTKFIFTLHGHVDDFHFVRKKWLKLIDYSLPEWYEPFGRELHLAIFYPNDKETIRDITHLFLKAPKHLAIEGLLKSEILTPELLEKFPQDRVIDFLREGALQNLIFNGTLIMIIIIAAKKCGYPTKMARYRTGWSLRIRTMLAWSPSKD